ncbi:hypothetical protein C5S31_05345 [ANME-1 cluster archaeon GoMg2]|nr:hypothetical protein [ANME-1 cluster archaeon GoMg2]
MEDDVKVDETPEKDVAPIFSFIDILKISSNVGEYRKWLKEYHKIEDDSQIFDGYKFFIDVCVRGFINSIIYGTSLDLEEDFTFFRARFVGVELEDIPNTCEKTIFIKNVWNLTKTIRKANGWEEITEAVKGADKLFFVFDVIFERAISSTRELNKKDALKISTIFNTHIFLNDTNRGVPHVYLLTPILKSSASEEYLEKVYVGYVYTLQYLWFVLLEKDNFEKSSLKDLHKAHDVYSKEAKEQIESQAGIPVSEEEIKKEFVTERKVKIREHECEIELVKELSDEDIKKLEAEKERLSKLKNWFALDMFFGKINEEIIEPLESRVGTISVFNPLLKSSDKINKSLISEFLRSDGLKDPKYLEATNDKNLIKKKLDYLFLWYVVNVLDAQKLTIFNGVPAFISTLIGNVELSRIFGNGEKVFVLRFKHPVTGVPGCDYSYGILNQAFGSFGFTDYSGWLIFFDCATDYSHGQAEVFIEKFLEEGKIEIKEYVVVKRRFKEYLAEKSTASVFGEIKHMTPDGVYTELSISEIQRKVEDFTGNAKGKFFEYLFYNWLAEKKHVRCKNIRCDYYLNKEEIDVLAEAEDKVYIFECKVNLHIEKIDEIKKQIENKVKAANQQFSKERIIPYLVVFSQIQNVHREKFEDAGIHVCSPFENKIKNWRKKDSRDAIFRILGSKFSLEMKT